MSTNIQGYAELVNRSLDPIFSNTSNNDFVFYTSTSNQSIHFGTQANGVAPSGLKVTLSNIEVNGDIALTKRVNLAGMYVTPRVTAGATQNITSTITNAPSISSNAGNVTLALSPGQSNFRFTNSNGTEVAAINERGTLTVPSLDFTSMMGGIKAWVNFNGQGSISNNQVIRASKNVSSVFKNAQGEYTINFTTPLSDSNYVVMGTTSANGNSDPTGGVGVLGLAATSPTGVLMSTTQCKIITLTITNVPQRVDNAQNHMLFIGI